MIAPDKHPRTGRWRGRYTDPSGRVLSAGTFATKAEAATAAKLAEARSRLAPEPERRRPTPTFAQYSDNAIDGRLNHGKPLAESTKYLYRVQLRKYLLPEFGSLQLSEITKGHIKRWPGHFRDDNLRNAFIVLRMILTEAEDDGLITTSPIPKGFEIGTVAGDRPTVSAEQFFDMIDIATPEMRLLLLLLWGASLRVGEALALTRGDLDLKAGAVDVTKQVRWLPGGAAVVDPKNDHKRYNVTLYPEALEALRERFNPDVFDRATPVLLGPNGRRLTRSTV